MKQLILRLGTLLSELKRRKVFRDSAVYLASAFMIAQAADIFLPGLGLPDWTLRLVLALLILGFPLAIVLSWMFDLTPTGIRRTAVFSPPREARSTGEGSPAGNTAQGIAGERYELLEQIGAGAMGVVYRARDRRLQREVALKFLPEHMCAHPAAAARFLQEARAAAALNQPNIMTLHAIEEDPARPFLVMELVEGETLEARLARRGTLDAAEATGIAAQVAAGLAAAHAKGIVHRDIKPANVMITPDGLVKVMDFGIAKVPGAVAMTQDGSTLGSSTYMSPEQVRGEAVDARSDLWALGVVMYEMLSGRLPFPGDNQHTVLHNVLHLDPVPLGELQPALPGWLTEAVMRLLSKDRADRPASAGALLAVLGEGHDQALSPATAREARPHRWRLAPIAAVLLAVAIPAAWLYQKSGAERQAREEGLPALLAMVEAQDCLQAMIKADELERLLPGERVLSDARTLCTVPTTILSEPGGADVYLRNYGDPEAPWFHLGTTPMQDAPVPANIYHWRVERDGFQTVEAGLHPWNAEPIHFDLVPLGEAPAGMVRVPGGALNVQGVAAELPAFWLDRHEVTNAEFQAFVAAGAYGDPALWTEPFVAAGRTLEHGEAMALLRDATGRPGPANWELGSHPAGAGDHPVTGVSWYEAVAYCRWLGKDLPTVFHWRLAAGANDPLFSDILWASNLDGNGLSAVGTHAGISRHGAYDMAGNAKEWTWNEVAGRRYALGGAWNEPMYMFADPDARAPLERGPTHGFRCARFDEPPGATAQAPLAVSSAAVAASAPVSDDIYAVLLRAYAYDDSPLNARVESVDELSPHWRRETVSLDAAYGGERFQVHLYFPRNATPPYHAVIYFPSSAATRLPTSGATDINFVSFVPRSGRVLVHPVLKGTYERRIQAAGPQAIRDLIIQRTKDLQRTVDYLVTREDIDPDRLAYFGFSLGATIGPISTAVEDRFAASILVAGGLSQRPDTPEASPLNFAPRVRVPTLMINGLHDFMSPYETRQKPLFELLGTPAPDKEMRTFDGGHAINNHDIIRESNDWLDRYLGPVRN
jgi:eukaryotic-like serine/threonine-protein kinase